MCHGAATLEEQATGPVENPIEMGNSMKAVDKPKPDEGRKDVTRKDEDTGAFRVPALREVANTAPYFHDGSAKTLEEAVALMAAGGKDLVEFLKGLSGKYPIVQPPKLP